MRRCGNWAALVAVLLVVSGALFVGLGLPPRTASVAQPPSESALAVDSTERRSVDEAIPKAVVEETAKWKPAAGFPQQADADLTRVRVLQADVKGVELEYALPKPMMKPVQVESLVTGGKDGQGVVSQGNLRTKADIVKEEIVPTDEPGSGKQRWWEFFKKSGK